MKNPIVFWIAASALMVVGILGLIFPHRLQSVAVRYRSSLMPTWIADFPFHSSYLATMRAIGVVALLVGVTILLRAVWRR